MTMMDFEVERCTRHCAASGRALQPGEEFVSALIQEGAKIKRQDYALAAWQEPPPSTIGWWKAKMPSGETKQAKLAPSEILMKLFRELEASPDQQDLRYVLALLMIRRRILRLEETTHGDPATAAGEAKPAETMTLYSPKDDETFQVPVVMPSDARVDEIQHELTTLLYVPSGASA